MNRVISLAAIPLLAAVATAQCFEQNFGVLAPLTGGSAGLGDDVAFDVQPLNFNFPMAGLATSYSHAQFGDNGNIFLTTGAPTTDFMGAGNAYVTTAEFVGATGSDPRIMPLHADLMADAAYGGGVYFNNTIPGKFVVTWVNMVEWYASTITSTPEVFTFQAQIFDSGVVQFYYDGRFSGSTYPGFNVRIGVSQGDGVTDPGSVDLTSPINQNLTDYVLYQEFAPGLTFDAQNLAFDFINVSPGYVQNAGPCNPAAHESYGAGCYEISDSFYELFSDAAIASTALNGHSMTMQLTGANYVVTWDSGVNYLSPTASATTVFAGATDDGETTITPSIPFPTPTGPAATLYVESNGIISWGAGGQSFPGTQDYTPTAGGFLNGVNAGIYSWHDYAEQDVAGGRIVYEEVSTAAGTLLVVSWDNVDQWPLGTAQPNFMQFQLNLSTGETSIVWQSLSNDTTSAFGSAHLVGYTAAGPSNDDGGIDLSATTTFLTSNQNIEGLKLTASPAPISTPTSGSVITYTTENMQQFSGAYIGMVILSVLPNPGTDLAIIGAPGCDGYVSTIDAGIAIFGVTPTLTAQFALPPGIASGVQIYAQSISLFDPNSLPNGQNGFGMITSNGIKSTISSF